MDFIKVPVMNIKGYQRQHKKELMVRAYLLTICENTRGYELKNAVKNIQAELGFYPQKIRDMLKNLEKFDFIDSRMEYLGKNNYAEHPVCFKTVKVKAKVMRNFKLCEFVPVKTEWLRESKFTPTQALLLGWIYKEYLEMKSRGLIQPTQLFTTAEKESNTWIYDRLNSSATAFHFDIKFFEKVGVFKIIRPRFGIIRFEINPDFFEDDIEGGMKEAIADRGNLEAHSTMNKLIEFFRDFHAEKIKNVAKNDSINHWFNRILQGGKGAPGREQYPSVTLWAKIAYYWTQVREDLYGIVNFSDEEYMRMAYYRHSDLSRGYI